MTQQRQPSTVFRSDPFDKPDRLRALEEYVYGVHTKRPSAPRLVSLCDSNDNYNQIERTVGDKIYVSRLSTSGYIARPNAVRSDSILVNTCLSGEALLGSERVRTGDIYINLSRDCQLQFSAGVYSRLVFPSTHLTSLNDSKDRLLVLRADDPVTQVIQAAAKSVEDVANQNDRSRLRFIEDVMISVTKRILDSKLNDRSRAGYDHIRDKSMDFIRGNIQRADLSVDEVARFAGVSRATLYRVFENVGGLKHFISAERISIAKSMLRVGRTDRGQISAVAYSTGFSSPERFSKVFKAQTGMNPKQFVEMS